MIAKIPINVEILCFLRIGNAKVVSSIPIIGTKLEKPILADGFFLLRLAFSAQGVKSISLPFPHIAERP